MDAHGERMVAVMMRGLQMLGKDVQCRTRKNGLLCAFVLRAITVDSRSFHTNVSYVNAVRSID